MYFEKESKRFLNTPNEIKHYKWEEDSDGFITNISNEIIPFN